MDDILLDTRLTKIESDVLAVHTDLIGMRGKIDLIDMRQAAGERIADLSKKSMWQEESEKMEVLA